MLMSHSWNVLLLLQNEMYHNIIFMYSLKALSSHFIMYLSEVAKAQVVSDSVRLQSHITGLILLISRVSLRTYSSRIPPCTRKPMPQRAHIPYIVHTVCTTIHVHTMYLYIHEHVVHEHVTRNYEWPLNMVLSSTYMCM